MWRICFLIFFFPLFFLLFLLSPSPRHSRVYNLSIAAGGREVKKVPHREETEGSRKAVRRLREEKRCNDLIGWAYDSRSEPELELREGENNNKEKVFPRVNARNAKQWEWKWKLKSRSGKIVCSTLGKWMSETPNKKRKECKVSKWMRNIR